jgi:YVTN family beta-propeller protein
MKTLTIALTTALLTVTLTATANAQGTLLVANQKDHTLSIIDAATAKQIAAIPEDRITGHEVATSPDGRTAYLPIYGDAGVGRPGSDGHEMLVIDIASRKITGTVDFGHGVRPHLPIYDTHRNVLYVSTELDEAITAIDPKTLKILYKIPTDAPQSHMYVLSHDGKFAYATNVSSGTISVLDLNARKTVATIPVAKSIQRISISNDDKLIFTSTNDSSDPRIAVIDTATRTIKTWIPLPAKGYGSASTRDGRYLIIAVSSASKIAVVDLSTLAVVRTIDAPALPQEVLIRPDGKVAYVSCNTSHQVVAIALDGPVDNWKTTLIEAGNGADGLAWATTTSH